VPPESHPFKSMRSTVRALGPLSALALIGHAATSALGGEALLMLNQGVFNALLVFAVLGCGARAVVVREERAIWLTLAGGMALWTLGNLYYTVEFLDVEEPPFPSLADALYLSFYPAAYVAIVLLVRRRVERFYASVWLDGLIGGAAVAALGSELVLGPVLETTGGTPAAVATTLAYPLADLLLMAIVVGVFALTGWRPGRSWALIGGGLATLAVADSLYLYRVATGAYLPGTVLDSLWPTGMVLLAWAAWQRPKERGSVRLDGWPVLVLPSLFTVTSLGLVIWGNFASVNRVALALATVTLVLAMVRTGLTFREVRALTERRRQALTDDLTGLPNRRCFLERVRDVIEGAQADDGPVALLIIDLDRFKELNDTLGHHAGDALLRQIGPRLSSILRPDDVLARLGGDEFAVLVPRGANAIGLAGRVREALEEPFRLDGLNFHMEASVGIAIYPEHGDDAHSLLRRADVAMYQAKGDRTGFELYAPERDVHSRERLALMGELRGAIERSELALVYQPKGTLAEGKITGVEALVRWMHPERGMVPPDTFLPFAEQTGLMQPLTSWVLDTALAQCAAWDAGGIRLRVAVNVSLPDLLDSAFPDDVSRALAAHGLSPERLQLEITENVIMADPVRVMDVLARLSELGVELSLDDYGTGYSSLSYLKRLPVRELKIDRSFVMSMESDLEDAVIVRSTAELGRSLGLRVVAEGVEGALAWEMLRRFGCDLAQGYFLSPPIPGADVAPLVRRRRAMGVPAGGPSVSPAGDDAGVRRAA
jgi:diguanylate cyclase (GGDEF)-like protein